MAVISTLTFGGVLAEILEKRGPEKVMKDLLVGFDPVSIFLDCLEERFGEIATFCVDHLGGSVIGIKWHSQVREPLMLHAPVQ